MNEQFMENTNAAISSELVQQAAQEVANPKNIIDAAIEAQKSDPGQSLPRLSSTPCAA